jgi:hypothetical protein
LGYISFNAGVSLWFLGLVITSTVVYLLYYAAIRYISGFQASLLVVILLLAEGGILVFWGLAIARGVLTDIPK